MSTEIVVTLLTVGVVAVGIYLAYLKYGRAGSAVEQKDLAGGLLYQLSLNKYYVDPWVIDGTVNGVAALVRWSSQVWRGVQTGNVQHYAAGLLLGTLALLAYYLGQS